MASGGSVFVNSTTQLEWTLGETFTQSLAQGTTLITLGFHQPDVVFTTGIEKNLPYSIQVFPNPSSGIVNLTVNNSNEELWIETLSSEGKLLRSENVKPGQNYYVDMSEYANGSYTIVIRNKANKQNTYQIIKNN